MTKFALSKIAAIVALGLSAAGAQAAAVTINFESFNTAIMAQTLVPPATKRPPVAVGSAATGTGVAANDFTFTGAWAYAYSELNSFDPTPGGQPAASGLVFAANKERNGSFGEIGLSWAGGNFAGMFLKSITFDMFVSAADPYVSGWAGLTAATPLSAPTFTTGDGTKTWATNTIDFGNGSQVSNMRFGSTVMSSYSMIGLDNIVIEFVASTTGNNPGGNVPEPASFGLVALALLGAGVAGRRRKPA